MLQFVFRRTLWIIPVLITISLITFVMMKSTPGGPFDVTSSGRDMPKETQELLMRRYHLDEPDWKQYLIYIGAWPTGNDAAGRRSSRVSFRETLALRTNTRAVG